MMRQKVKYIIIAFCLCLWLPSFSVGMVVSGGSGNRGDEQVDGVPSSFRTRLDSLKQKDDLAGWLNAWYVYLSDDPASHYRILTVPVKHIWRAPTTSSEQIAWFYLLVLGGYYKLQQGDILASTNLYEKAYRFAKEAKALEDDEILEYLIKPLGNNYTRLGDYERAFYIQKEGLKRARKIEDTMQEAAMLANMSTTARWNDHQEKAIKLAGEGLQKVKPGTPLQGLLYSTQADILQEVGRLKEAQKVIDKGLQVLLHTALARGKNNTYWYAGALMTAGTIAQKEHQFNKGSAYYQHAARIYQKYFPQSRHREKMKAYVALGKISLDKKTPSEALAYFNQALTGLLPAFNGSWPADAMLYPENTLLDALTGKAKALHQRGKNRVALKGYQKATVVLQKLRKTIFSREAKRLLQQQSLQTTEDGIALAYQLFQETGEAQYGCAALQMAENHKAGLLLDDLQKNRAYAGMAEKDTLFQKQKKLKQAIAFYIHSYRKALLQHHKQDSIRWKQRINQSQYRLSMIRQEIRHKYPSSNWSEAPEDVEKMAAELPDSMAVWEYFAGPKKWYGFSISHDGVQEFSFLGKADTLRSTLSDFVSSWFDKGPSAMINQPKKYNRTAYYVFRMIRLKRVKKQHRLLIIPAGELGHLPFDALITDTVYHVNPERWDYFLFRAMTSYSYSLAVWQQLQHHTDDSPEKQSFAGFFINPDKNSNLATLDGVKKEEAQIRKTVGGSFYQGSEATSRQLIRAVKEKEVIHISTHSFLLGKKRIPALQMANKKMLLADLYPLRVHPSLIVMSACQTAEGLLAPGEGIISLAREFIAVGARGVIASLWSINDETAADLTASFYEKLQKSGRKAEALYRTKKAWLAGSHGNAALKLPYYWAGMVYYGNSIPLSQSLKSPPDSSFWEGWLIGGILFLLLLFWIGWRRKKRKERTRCIPLI